jgi:hypothetical protein
MYVSYLHIFWFISDLLNMFAHVFSSQTIATYFSQVMAAVGANTAGPGIVISD